jgi:hypothetical protein
MRSARTTERERTSGGKENGHLERLRFDGMRA